MRILYISPSVLPSRAANTVHVLYQCYGFLAAGHVVVLAAKRSAPDEGGVLRALERDFGIDVFRLEFFSYYSVLSCVDNMRIASMTWRVLRRGLQADLVLSRNLYASYILADRCAADALGHMIFAGHVPGKMFERMGSGAPLIFSVLPALEDVPEESCNALLAEPDDPQSWIAALLRLEEDSDLAQRIGAEAHRIPREIYLESTRTGRVRSHVAMRFPSLDATGLVKGAVALANGLAAHWLVTLAVLKNVPDPVFHIEPSIRVVQLAEHGAFRDRLAAYRHLLKEAGGRARAASLSMCLSTDFFNALCKGWARIIASVRGNLPENYRMDYGPVGLGAAATHLVMPRRFDTVTAMSGSMASQIRRFLGRRPEVFHNVIDEAALEQYRIAILASKDGAHRFVFAGSLCTRKKPLALVDALHTLKEQGVDARITLVGEGPLHGEIEQAVSAHGLEDRVELTGQLSAQYPGGGRVRRLRAAVSFRRRVPRGVRSAVSGCALCEARCGCEPGAHPGAAAGQIVLKGRGPRPDHARRFAAGKAAVGAGVPSVRGVPSAALPCTIP